MAHESPFRAVLVVVLVALVCSSLVSGAVVVLRPIQLENRLLERSRTVIGLTGLLPPGAEATGAALREAFEALDARIVDLDAGWFESGMEVSRFDYRGQITDPDPAVKIPAALDHARLGQRSRYAPVYLVWQDNALRRVVLPVHGNGMWSMLYGYVALEADLRTIAAATFYEQNETAGLGDQVTRRDWLRGWAGRRIYDDRGEVRFAVATDAVESGSAAARYEVDALSGATVTADAVTALIAYWFGPHGYGPFLDRLREGGVDALAVTERGP